MKSRKAAKAMTEYLRTVNPELAAAMTDERDEVMLQPSLPFLAVKLH